MVGIKDLNPFGKKSVASTTGENIEEAKGDSLSLKQNSAEQKNIGSSNVVGAQNNIAVNKNKNWPQYILYKILSFFAGFFKSVFRFFLYVLIFAFIGAVLAGFDNARFRTLEDYETKVIQESDKSDDIIAVVRMEGTIIKHSYSANLEIGAEDYIELLQKLKNAKDVKGVVLLIDSPGGEVYAADMLYRKIKELASKKPVYVYAESTLASGAYYIAMGASKVYVNNLTTVGSIGVIAEFYNYDGLLNKLGVKVRKITNTGGKYKTGDGLFDSDPNGEEDKLIQRLIDSAYERFVFLVAQGRHMSIEDVKKIADGRIMPASDAKQYNLVDKITTLDMAISDLKTSANIKDANVIEYQPSHEIPFINSLLGMYNNTKLLFLGQTNTYKLLYQIKY